MRILVVLAFAFFVSGVSAQETITGIVTDGNSGDPLPYVYLKVSGVALGTVTEADGTFRIAIPRKYDTRTLVFSYLGYESQDKTIAELRGKKQLTIALPPVATELAEIVVRPKKLPTARAILRKALARVGDNFADFPTQLTGYYRETISENGSYIKIADAALDFHLSPYGNKKYKWKEYQSSWGNGTTMSAYGDFAGANLHRSHFHHQTLKNDRVRIIDSRASENLTTRRMKANISGGPLSLYARDRVKYQESFLGKKRRQDFNYLVDEVKDENGKWIYALQFRTTTTREQLMALRDGDPNTRKGRKFKNKVWFVANRHKLLRGTIYVDPDSYAILGYECSVPNELKEFFCGYTTMAIKHFDYKLDVRYKEVDGKYVIDYLRHEDEFIYKDTTDNTTTPYAAVSEFRTLSHRFKDIPTLTRLEHFANVNTNQLYDYPLAYDSLFWTSYVAKNPKTRISDDIRQDMEGEKLLETQFRDKQIRDDSLPAPIAPVDPTVTKLHGDRITDDYAWLKDTKSPRSNERIMDYLEAENDYATNYFLPLRKSQRQLFGELTFSVEKNYKSLPSKSNGYYYHVEYQEEDEHPVYFRSPVDNPARKDTLMDVNVEAKKYDYYSAGITGISPDNSIMAYSENTDGSDRYVVRFKNLTDGTMINDSLVNYAGFTWVDNQTILYTEQEAKTLRSYRVLRHRLGTDQAKDEIVFTETDPEFNVDCYRSKSKEFLFISSGNNDASEIRYLRADNPEGPFKLIVSRDEGYHYGLQHHDDKFYVTTDNKALNGRIMVTDTNRVAPRHWKEMIAHRDDVMINGLTIFDNYFVINEKADAQPRLRIIDRRTQEEHYLKQKEDFYSIGVSANEDTDTDTLRYTYSSFATPVQTIDYHMTTKESRIVRKAKRAVGGGKMIVRRAWATAPDGAQIPLTIVYDKWRGGKAGKREYKRVYLTSYGAYGSGQGVGYSPMVNALTSRGFIYVLAHVRGGNDLGTKWYHDGRMLKKKNTFTDFIACAELLITEGYADKGSITAQGGSAGGLLMGAVANMRPDLFHTIILDVPFVDVVNTMLDEKLPLTVGEFKEWGNPKEKKYYNYLKDYSPYENVVPQAYPNLLFFTGLNDTRVGYWEPAKMVAKLRRMKTDDKLLLFKTDLTAGHGGGAGRYAGYRDQAYKLAILFDLYNRKEMSGKK